MLHYTISLTIPNLKSDSTANTVYLIESHIFSFLLKHLYMHLRHKVSFLLFFLFRSMLTKRFLLPFFFLILPLETRIFDSYVLHFIFLKPFFPIHANPISRSTPFSAIQIHLHLHLTSQNQPNSTIFIFISVPLIELNPPEPNSHLARCYTDCCCNV